MPVSHHPRWIKNCNSPEYADPKQYQFDYPNYDLPGAEEVPLSCTPPEQAMTYCKWVGGVLPTSEQLLYASRGSSFQVYPWGNEKPSCDHHPAGESTLPHTVPCCIGGVGSGCALEWRRVGVHPKGSSPSGLQDVAVAGFEMVRPSENSVDSSCRKSFCTLQCSTSGGNGGDFLLFGVLVLSPFRCTWTD